MTKKIASRLLKTIILAIFVFPSIHPGRMGINILFMNTNVDLFHDSTKNSSEILTSESNEMGLSTIFNYNGNNVAFIKTSYGILINATDMARPYNKRPVDYLRQIYVNELVSTIVSQTHISEDQLVIKMRGSSENGGGTWLYEDVAIDFAQWLDVKFKVWCNSKIKELLTTGLVKLPNFNNPPEAARAWADEYEARMKAEKEVRLALEAKEKIEKEKRMVQAELNTAIDTIKENEPVIDMFKRSIPREGVLIRESSKYFEQFGYYIGIKNMYPLLQELKYVFRNERGRIEAYQSAFSAYKQAHSKFFFASSNNRSARFSNSPSGSIIFLIFICMFLCFAKE